MALPPPRVLYAAPTVRARRNRFVKRTLQQREFSREQWCATMYVAPINSVVPAGVGSGTQFQRTMPTNRSASNLVDSLDSFASTFTSTSPPFSKPAMIVPSGWTPKEAKTMPTAAERAAGMRGVIDNTVRFKPLPPMYGKSKEYHRGENQAKVHLTAPDTLAEIKGLKHSDYPPFGPAECVPAVLTQYSKPVPLQYKMDPMRIDRCDEFL